ncbi:hypothetical protein E24_00139 [Faustovirus]|nr:hypothetical protein E24_00139 [Faustovirus]AMN84054.1 hypothetical protein D5a_00138 [Faustovirus]AMN85040.1 hypothetical protein E23_00138 [Faustovirus]
MIPKNIEVDTRLSSPKDEENAWRPSICKAKRSKADAN